MSSCMHTIIMNLYVATKIIYCWTSITQVWIAYNFYTVATALPLHNTRHSNFYSVWLVWDLSAWPPMRCMVGLLWNITTITVWFRPGWTIWISGVIIVMLTTISTISSTASAVVPPTDSVGACSSISTRMRGTAADWYSEVNLKMELSIGSKSINRGTHSWMTKRIKFCRHHYVITSMISVLHTNLNEFPITTTKVQVLMPRWIAALFLRSMKNGALEIWEYILNSSHSYIRI